MSVTVFSSCITWCDTKQPCLDITIDPSTEDAFGRSLRIIKERSEDHWYRTQHGPTCDSLVKIMIVLPEKECILVDLGQFIRPDTCDYVSASENTRQISCSAQTALQVLDTVIAVSQKFFNTKEKWHEQAKTFIENGPQAEVIIEQLSPVEECGFEDLVEKASNDNYEHPVPDTDNDIEELFAYADEQVNAVAENAVDDEQPVPDKEKQSEAKFTVVVDAQVDDIKAEQDVSTKAKSSSCLNVFQTVARIGQVACNLLLRIGGNLT